jgi:hypothetical protein
LDEAKGAWTKLVIVKLVPPLLPLVKRKEYAEEKKKRSELH